MELSDLLTRICVSFRRNFGEWKKLSFWDKKPSIFWKLYLFSCSTQAYMMMLIQRPVLITVIEANISLHCQKRNLYEILGNVNSLRRKHQMFIFYEFTKNDDNKNKCNKFAVFGFYVINLSKSSTCLFVSRAEMGIGDMYQGLPKFPPLPDKLVFISSCTITVV